MLKLCGYTIFVELLASPSTSLRMTNCTVTQSSPNLVIARNEAAALTRSNLYVILSEIASFLAKTNGVVNTISVTLSEVEGRKVTP